MANEIALTVVGNLTADPELRFTPGGKAVANFTICSTPRTFKDGAWTDGEPTFLRCQLWGQPAENASECLYKGSRVVATGKLQQRAWETREGEKRSSLELLVDEIAVSIKFGTAKLNKATRTNGGGARAADLAASKALAKAELGATETEGEPPF